MLDQLAIGVAGQGAFDQFHRFRHLVVGQPFGAKGAGELTLVGAAPAYVTAVENAAGKEFRQIPLTPEKIMEVIA